MRFIPPARVVDAGILVAVAVAAATGLVSLVAGQPSDAWVFAIHGIVGLTLVGLIALKLYRVSPRLRQPSRWDRRVVVSVLTLGVAGLALVTGIAWSFGGKFGVLLWTGLSVHVLFGLLTIPILVYHLTHRFRLPDRVDFQNRRTAIQLGLLVLGGAVAWRAQQLITEVIGTANRFTGSRVTGRQPGNTFPVTSWVADDPDPVDLEEWRLRIDGAVSSSMSVEFGALHRDDTSQVILDCTSGWYTDQEWGGIRVARLLDEAEPEPEARWVSFHSVTGYRWSLPIDEAQDALLATNVGGERLTHGHGAPLRLVAPGRRGFQWVKWIERIEVRTDPDYGQWIAIFTSGFS